jgi:hypothetical protein
LYLARWWVNGKPVEAALRKEIVRYHDIARQFSSQQHDRIAFGLPETLGAIRAGDVVGLQVMYCPDGHKPLNHSDEDRYSKRNGRVPAIPLLSDKIEFKITEELLKKAGDRKETKYPKVRE